MRPANEAHHQNTEILLKEEYWACFAIPVLFWLLASLTIAMGYYGVKSMVLGPNYSHLIKANSLFVDHIKVTEYQKGAVLYSFSVRPVLGSRALWSENHTILLEPNYHQEYTVSLNKGSKLRVSCWCKSLGFYNVLLTVSQAYNGGRRWFRKSTQWHTVDVWTEVHDQFGNLEYEAKQDGDYFVAIRNLNEQAVAIELELEVNATIYNTQAADTKCILGATSCKVSLPMVGKRYVLLTTNGSENNNLTWEVELVYGVRWISYYIILAGILLFVATFLKIMNSVSRTLQWQTMTEDSVVDEDIQSSLLALKDEGRNSVFDSNIEDGSKDENASNSQLCAICLDARKAIFFIPCGHSATCLACAKRIRHHEMGCCPICRVKIEKVGKVFR